MKPSIRLATTADAVGCLDIYRPFVLETAVSFEMEEPSLGAYEERMERILQWAPWLVCEHEGQLAGFAYASRFRPRAAYRWSVETTVYVHESFRGQGLGRALYTDLLEFLRHQGIVNAYAAITLPNSASVVLHERLGFRPLAVLHHSGYKLEQWHDVGWWHLPLSDPPARPGAPLSVAEAARRMTWLPER